MLRVALEFCFSSALDDRVLIVRKTACSKGLQQLGFAEFLMFVKGWFRCGLCYSSGASFM
jgi:hypothetical protein